MAPRAKTAGAVAYDSEDDLAATTIGGIENKHAAITKTNKAKSTARRGSATKATAKRKAAPKQPRQALKDRTNVPDGNETEEVDAFDDDEMAGDAAKPRAKKAKTTAATHKTAASKKQVTEDETKLTKRGRPAKPAPSSDPMMTIPETQQDPEAIGEDIEQSIEMDPDNMDISREPTPKQTQKYVQRAPSVPLQPRPSARGSTRPTSAQPGYPSMIRERSGSASGTERRGGDPELRRQLNDLTKRYETLQMKYDTLEEIGKSNAETNFEKLKRASDQKAKDANEVIASLKKEIAELQNSSSSVASETSSLQKQVTTLTTSSQKVTAERDDLKEKLHVSQNEVKALEAKVMAARQQVANSVQAQEAATKKNALPSNTHMADSAKEAKMKENLYADLTGLMVLNVKRSEGEDIYDCVQTGRNGTLHFHLNVGNDSATPHPKTPSGLSYADAEFAYEPFFDESRDKDLLDLLPDYLTEEICFPRNHAQRFYGKVVESMTKKIVVDEDE